MSLVVIGCIAWILSYIHNITLPVFPGMKAVRIPAWATLFFGKSKTGAVPPEAISPLNLGFFLFSMYVVLWGIAISLFRSAPALHRISGIFLSMGLAYVSAQLLYKVSPYRWKDGPAASDFGSVVSTGCINADDPAYLKEKPAKLTIRNSRIEMLFEIIWALCFTTGLGFVLFSVWRGTLGPAWLVGATFFGLLAYLGWAMAFSTIQITEQTITVTVFYGRFRIYWDEVEKIILYGPYLALTGNGKRVVLSLQQVSPGREKLLEYFHHQIEQRNIAYAEDFRLKPLSELTHQNARIGWIHMPKDAR